MTTDEHAERASAELDREGLSPASAADAPRIRAIIADAIHAAVEGERERAAGWLRLAFTAIDRYVPISQVPDGLDDAREFLAGFRQKDQPGQVRLDLTADEVEELDRLTWSADMGVRDEGWQSGRRTALGRKVRNAIAVVRGQQGGAGA
jgi:hypothetical protein